MPNRNLGVLLLFLGISLISANGYSGEEKIYGTGITIKQETKISDILAAPDKYLGQKVLIKGRVIDVCKKRGCWMEIASDKESESIQVKVNDGEIIFPLEIRGKLVMAEGTVEKLELTLEKTKLYLQHRAEENGESIDTTKINASLVIYRIRGLGAKLVE